MNRIIIGGALFFLCLLSFGCLKKHLLVEVETKGEQCMPESIYRYFFNDSSFVQISVFQLTDDTYSSRLDTFKIINGDWFYKNQGQFYDYFSKSGFFNGDTILLRNDEGRVYLKQIPLTTDSIASKLMFVFKVESIHYNYFPPKVWFDPNYGTVRIITPTLNCEKREYEIVNEQLLSKASFYKKFEYVFK